MLNRRVSGTNLVTITDMLRFADRWERRCPVATYIALVNWTDQGAKSVKDSARCFDAAKKMLQDMGGDFKAVFMTMGEYDLVIVYEAPDDAVAARFTLQFG